MAGRSQQFAARIGWPISIGVHLRFQNSCVPLPRKPGGWPYILQQAWAVILFLQKKKSLLVFFGRVPRGPLEGVVLADEMRGALPMIAPVDFVPCVLLTRRSNT
jgi:hypothetical protein